MILSDQTLALIFTNFKGYTDIVTSSLSGKHFGRVWVSVVLAPVSCHYRFSRFKKLTIFCHFDLYSDLDMTSDLKNTIFKKNSLTNTRLEFLIATSPASLQPLVQESGGRGGGGSGRPRRNASEGPVFLCSRLCSVSRHFQQWALPTLVSISRVFVVSGENSGVLLQWTSNLGAFYNLSEYLIQLWEMKYQILTKTGFVQLEPLSKKKHEH